MRHKKGPGRRPNPHGLRYTGHHLHLLIPHDTMSRVLVRTRQLGLSTAAYVRACIDADLSRQRALEASVLDPK